MQSNFLMLNFRFNKGAKKLRIQNINEIDLKSNSEISNFLESSVASKPKSLISKQRAKHSSKIRIFEHEFQKSPRFDDLGMYYLQYS